MGCALKQIGLIQGGDGHALVRIIVTTTLPALVFVSLVRVRLDLRTLGLLALCGGGVSLVLLGVAIYIVRRTGWQGKIGGVVVLCTLAANVGLFLSPFFQTFYGSEGLSRVAAFDLGNSLVAWSLAPYVAMHYGNGHAWDWRAGAKRVLSTPILWADLLAIIVGLSSLRVPALLMKVLDLLAAGNTPLAMLALGSFIELRFRDWKPMFTAVTLRMGGAWILGQAFVALTGLKGLDRTVTSVACAMPVGVMALAYASLEGLDVGFAAITLSLSLLIGIVITPLLLGMY